MTKTFVLVKFKKPEFSFMADIHCYLMVQKNTSLPKLYESFLGFENRSTTKIKLIQTTLFTCGGAQTVWPSNFMEDVMVATC